MVEWIAIIITLIVYVTGLVSVWINLNLKVKEIETKLVAIEAKVKEESLRVKEERLEMLKLIQNSNEKIWNKLDGIENKIDKKFEEFTVLKTEHEQYKEYCKFSDKK